MTEHGDPVPGEDTRGARVIQMGVREEHGGGCLARGIQQRMDRLRLETGVDDDRLIRPVGREEPAIRPVRVAIEDVEVHGVAMLPEGFARAADAARAHGTTASTSTSTFQRGSRSPATTIIVDAGRTSPKTVP